MTKASAAELLAIENAACPGAGACGGMYTANTMAAAIEALGMSLPYSSSNPAISDDKKKECLVAGAAIRLLMERDIKPRDIMTREAFEVAKTAEALALEILDTEVRRLKAPEQ